MPFTEYMTSTVPKPAVATNAPAVTLPYQPPNQPNYDPEYDMPFNQTPPAVLPPEDIDPVAYQAGIREAQKGFYNEFASKFHKQSFRNLEDYQKWVDTLPYTADPELRGYINETALKYMPTKLKIEYATKEANTTEESKYARQMNNAINFAKVIKEKQDSGELDKSYYWDAKEGLKKNLKMLPSANDPLKVKLIELRAAQDEVKKFVKLFETDKAEKAQLKADKLLQDITNLANMGDMAQPQGAGDTGEIEELKQAIEYAQSAPNDPVAQQAGQIAAQRLQELGL